MLDIGSPYTILNGAAVKMLDLEMDNLPVSPQMCAGIDGKPMQVFT